MATFARPESALKRAEEFIKVGRKQAALQTLHDVIVSKRYQAWQKILEQIMLKFVELCVDMRMDMFAKDGLIRYRVVCQKVNVSSLEEVITHFLHLSIEKAREAQKQAEGLKEALDVDDLEADKSPEDLMLCSVSGEKGRDRYDHELIMPWFKFLWKTYRIVIEVLRNNSNLEGIYSMTVHRAFHFCKQYKRTKEFHWLCEITRNHLSTVTKRGAQRDRPDLAPESLQLYLENQFKQLKIATELALWKEAFRSVEDIYGLMRIIKKSPKATLMIIYYAKLADILWVAESHLYHAYAWFKIFTHQKNCYKNISQKDLQLIASSTLLAALSVIPYDQLSGASQMELEKEKERNLRMASLISFTVDSKHEKKEPFSRSSLLSELVSSGVYSCALQEVKDLYNLLEHEFLPLDLGSKVQPLLTKISKIGGNLASASSFPEVQLSKYVPALERVATLRLLQQVSQVYSAMKIGILSRMIPFYDFSFVEKISVDAIKCNFIALKIDHLKGVIFFGNIHLESDIWLNHSSVLAESLNKSRSLIYPLLKKPSNLGVSLHALAVMVDKEHKRLLARKLIIEKRKEEQERQLLEMEREGELKRLKIEKMMEEAEQKRLASEYLRREEQRIRRQIEERELEQHKTLLQDTEKRRDKGKKPVIEGDTVTKESLFVLALRKQLKQRQEMEKKLQKLAKTMDYLEKAKREKEAPLIEAAFQKHLMEEEELHEHVQEQEIMLSWLCHSKNLEEKRRLTRMVANKMIFQNRVAARQYTERKEKIKREREIKRKLLFYLRCKEEEQKKLWEQEEARKREEAARKKKEDAERRAKLDESAEKQRLRLREIEEREAQLGKFGLPIEPPISAHPPNTVSAAPTLGKYVPPVLRREGTIDTGASPTLEPDRRTRSDGMASSQADRRVSHDRRAALGTIGSGRSSKWSAPKISEW